MYQNDYVLSNISRQYVQERQEQAREDRKARLAEAFRRELRRRLSR